MRQMIVILIVVCVLHTTAWCTQKYDYHKEEWVTTTQDAGMVYDSYNEAWGYHSAQARQEYNPYSEEWEWTDTQRGGSDE